MKQKDKMNARIKAHGEALKKVFGLDDNIDSIKLAKKLYSIELRANKAAENYCNGIISTYDWCNKIAPKIAVSVSKALGCCPNREIHINGDARGYALKIDLKDGELLYRDWGGYGILAPDLRSQIAYGI